MKKTDDTKEPTHGYAGIVLNSLPERELEIIGEITAEKMSLVREKALKKIKEDMELPGFRKGNAPDALVIQKVGEMRLLEEAAEMALSEEYPRILVAHNVEAIGRPDISITKMASGNALGFKIKTALTPHIQLADYKETAKKIVEAESKKETSVPEITEAEVDDVIKTIRENIAHQKVHSDSEHVADIPRDQHSHREIIAADLPEINDEFAKMIGGFENVADMREKIRENILMEKEIKEKDKKRTHILEAIMEKSEIELPKIIIEGETEKMLAQFKDDIAKAGVVYAEYLAHIKKTEVDLKLEWKVTAVKRAKSQVILNTIARDEAITPTEEEIKKEMTHILQNYPDSDRFRVRMYVETFMTNEMVFQFLEKQ